MSYRSQSTADHYAILEEPDSSEDHVELEQRLMRCNIKPIWYENGVHEKVQGILELLLL